MFRPTLLTGAVTAALVAVATVAVPGRRLGSEATVQANLQTYFAGRAAAWAGRTSFSFGVYSDIHMSDDANVVLTRAQWQSLLTNWRDTGNLFGVIVGDLGFGQQTNIDNVLSGPAAVPTAPPVFYSMGNHELDAIGKRAWIDALYPGAVATDSWTVTAPIAPGNADHTYWSFNVGPSTHLVMLDGDFVTWDGITQRVWQTFGQAQLNWLAADLQANTDKNILVFIHEPIDQQLTGNTPELTMNDKGSLIDLLAQHPKPAYIFSGHLHGLPGITKWRGVTSVHVQTGNNPNYGVRVSVNGETISITGSGTSTFTDFDANPMNQTTTINGQQVLRVAEENVSGGNTRNAKMLPVSAENGVTPTSGVLMLKSDAMTWYAPKFISEQLVKVVPGMKFSYDLFLYNVTANKDAVTVQPHWYLKNGSRPPLISDQNWIPLSRRPRDGTFFPYNDDTPSLQGRATGQWYHRDFDLSPMVGGFVDGVYLTSAATNVNVAAIYADNIRFTWPASGAVVNLPRTNYALAANGAIATASSTLSANYAPATIIDDDRRGTPWGTGGGWNDATSNAFPDWVQIDFNGTKTIDEINVFSVQDTYTVPINPTPTQTFTLYGLRDFEVQFWTGSTWQAVPGGSIVGNNLVWRKVTFPAISTSRIRIYITQALNNWSRVTEVEAYGGLSSTTAPTVSVTNPANNATLIAPVSMNVTATATDADGIASVTFYANGAPIGIDATSPYSVPWANMPLGTYTLTAAATDLLGATSVSAPVVVTVVPPDGRLNVALATNGGVAVASSTFSAAFPGSGAINGDRRGHPWSNGGGWNDATSNLYPDWLEVDFDSLKTITEVDVFSVQDAYTAPVDPTPTMTFSLYGLRDFEVQYWTGTVWQAVPNGTVTGNSLVWRMITFPPLSTTKIRVYVTSALANWSRIAEIEAYGGAAVTNLPPSVSVTSPLQAAAATAPASFTLSANATDSDGTVASVAFYANGSIVGTDNTAPYSLPWTNVPAGAYAITAVATDNLGATATSTPPVNVTVTSAVSNRTNVALAANGGVSLASSTFSTGYPTSAAINGDRKGQPWGNGGGWNDGTSGVFPDWFEVDFNGTKTVDEVDVFSVQDNYAAPVDPTSTMTFSLYGLRDFEVQYWTGNNWLPVPGGSVVGNSLVWRQVTFSAVTTSKVRVMITQGLASWSRVAEVEVWGVPAARINFAATVNGGAAVASSVHSAPYPASAAINGDRTGAPWGNGGGWNDGTASTFPDWLEVDFSGSKIIDELNVFSVQDNYAAPIEPTLAMTCSLYGLRDFEVQYWSGTAWVTVPGTSVTSNTLVWRRFTFTPITTTKIRVYITNAGNTWSRLAEVEAVGPGG